jgi:flagella basal body P-ring formation protein FlgA
MNRWSAPVAFLVAALLSAGCPAVRGQAAVLTLRTQAQTTGEFVRLSEVADLSGAVPAGAPRPEAIYLGRAPEGESAREIGAEEVLAALRRNAADGVYRLAGGGATRVTRAGLGPQESALRLRAAALLREALAAFPALEDCEIEVEILSLDAPPGADARDLRASIDAADPLAGPFPFALSDGAGPDCRGAARARAFRPVVVTRWTLRANAPLASADLALERREIRAGEKYFFRVEDVRPFHALRVIRPGTALTRDMLRGEPLVRKRALVAVVWARDGLRVEGRATALDDGELGHLVPIVSLDTRVRRLARVVGRGVVQPAGPSSLPPPELPQ